MYKEDVRELLQAGIYGLEHVILDEALSKDEEIWQEELDKYFSYMESYDYSVIFEP